MSKVLINITSYNRKEMLENLLSQLNGYDVKIWDDSSDFDVDDYGVKSYRTIINYGKKQAWVKWNLIFELIKEKHKDYDYYIFLPDDVVLGDNFVERSIKLWDNIQDKNKICMSYSSPERLKQSCFTNKEPIDCGDVVKTQWCDMMFICGKDFIEKVIIDPVDKHRWNTNPNLSSGVGSKISHFFNFQHSLYHAKEEMAKHIGNDCSLMNPEIRKDQPL